MRLLVDQNISFRILKLLKSSFPDSEHVKNVNLFNSDDKKIWDYARLNDYIIVTQDSDFNDFVVVKGFPPKIIWFKTGNMTTKDFAALLVELKNDIFEFYNNSEHGIFEIHKRR